MINIRKLFPLIFLLRAFTIINCDIGERIKKLEILVNEHVLEHEVLKDRLNILERNVSVLGKEIFNRVNLEDQSGHKEVKQPGDIKHTSTVLEKQLSRRASAGEVAFHAYLSSSRHYSNHEILIFDKTTVNDRLSYTTDDGIFDIPVAGIYAFTWTVVVPAQSPKITTELVVHGSVKGVLVSDSDDGVRSVSGVHPSTAFAVAHVGVGDNVFIRVRGVSSGDGVVLSDNNNVHSTFSAWRLV